MEVAPMARGRKVNAIGVLPTKTEEGRPAKPAEQTIHAHLVGTVPEVGHTQAISSHASTGCGRSEKLTRARPFQYFVSINPQHPVRCQFDQLAEQEVLVPTFVQASEGRLEDRNSFPQTSAECRCTVGGVIVENYHLLTERKDASQNFLDPLRFIFYAESSKDARRTSEVARNRDHRGFLQI